MSHYPGLSSVAALLAELRCSHDGLPVPSTRPGRSGFVPAVSVAACRGRFTTGWPRPESRSSSSARATSSGWRRTWVVADREELFRGVESPERGLGSGAQHD
jgi:hypothetical protein